jgi:hypothetical protein
MTPSGTELLPINDSFEVAIPRGCGAEQVANYYNDNLILINSDIWAAFDETDRAALILHEAVYAANRLVGATNSRQSRHVVASIFDSVTQWTDPKDQVPKQALNCIGENGGLFLWAYKDSSNDWVLQFQKFPVLKGEDRIGTSTGRSSQTQSMFEGDDWVSVTKRWEAIKGQDGKVIKGFQTPRYYLSWMSGTFPKTYVEEQLLNCSVTLP